MNNTSLFNFQEFIEKLQTEKPNLVNDYEQYYGSLKGKSIEFPMTR